MGDDVVEHLTAIDKLEEHVPVIVGTDDISQAADVGMIEECDDGGLSGCSNLLGLVCTLLFGSALVVVVGRASRDNLASNLASLSVSLCRQAYGVNARAWSM
jgi:hypothetical protein